MEVVLLAQRGDLCHHRGSVVNVECLLTAPAVYQQNSFGIVHREEIFIALVAVLVPLFSCV